jgi:hypothetical protein
MLGIVDLCPAVADAHGIALMMVKHQRVVGALIKKNRQFLAKPADT